MRKHCSYLNLVKKSAKTREAFFNAATMNRWIVDGHVVFIKSQVTFDACASLGECSFLC